MLAEHPTLSTTALRDDIADTLGRVRHGQERLVITKNSKPAAAMISLEDLELLERLEDKLDLLLADEAEAASKKKGEKPVRLADVKLRLGL